MSERRENQIYIHAPALRHPHRRAGDQLLTLIMWGVYAYLWLPFISLVAWYLGVDLFYQEMVVNGGFDAFIGLSGWYLLVILIMMVIVIGWSRSNYLRFHERNRRQAMPPVDQQEIAEWFGLETSAVAEMKQADRLELSFDPDGRLTLNASDQDGPELPDSSGSSPLA